MCHQKLYSVRVLSCHGIVIEKKTIHITLIRLFSDQFQKKFGCFCTHLCAKIKRAAASVGYQIVTCFFPQAVDIYDGVIWYAKDIFVFLHLFY